MKAVLPPSLNVLNLGIPSFLPALTESGTKHSLTDWRPPARGDSAVGFAAARLLADPKIEEANDEALRRLIACNPVLTGAAPASDLLPVLKNRHLLHAGPPLKWEEAAGPVKGALAGAVLLEGWARTPEEAESLLSAGKIPFEPCHHQGAVGPMAGVISPSMPLWIVEDPSTGKKAYCNFNEGLGKVLRFGANGPEVLERLTWMRDRLFPLVKEALAKIGGWELRPLMARALQMGDELHNRNAAASALFHRVLAPALVETGRPSSEVTQVMAFIAANDHFFLNLSMAACKLATDAAKGVEGSTLCTAMARNGTHFGVQISGLEGQWFTAPAPVVEGLFFAGYSAQDAAPDLGDSAITETAGLGGMSLAAAPAIIRFVGGSSSMALESTQRMYRITRGEHPEFTLPGLDFRGSPVGIDARLVVDLNLAPVINTGIAHRKAGIGQIGAGITAAPLECFEKAVAALSLVRYGTTL